MGWSDVLLTKHCLPCQVDPVLRKLQDRYRGPEPSDMVEMFEGEQFFAAFERGISIDMGMAVLGSFCSYQPPSCPALALDVFLLWVVLLHGVPLCLHSPTTHSSQPLDIELVTFSDHITFLSTFPYESAVCRLLFLLILL